MTALGVFHAGLQKALVYITENFQEEVALGHLARHACLSISHLCCLFRQTLGVRLTILLALAGIEKAEHLLVQKRSLTVTEISGRVGFGDLRHCERRFKQMVGYVLREYRRAALEPKKLENPPHLENWPHVGKYAGKTGKSA